MDFIGKIFLMIVDFLLTRKTVIEFISCPTKLMSSSFRVRGRPFAAAIFCSQTATSVISNAAAVGLDVVYQVALAYQLVFLCRCLFFFTLVVFFIGSWRDYIPIVEQNTSSSSSYSLSPPASPCCADSRLRYDVFISFRGPDTRQNFTSHLAEALSGLGIEVLIDRELEKGEDIWAGLMDAIERSTISVVVLSENYAFSSWCLDEVAKIVECRRSRGQIVLPVFYGVKPTEVRRQKGKYGFAFAMHQKASKSPEMAEKIKRWRDALTEVAGLFGFDSHVVR